MAFEQKSVKNAAVSVAVGGLLSRAIGFIGSIALARILVPEDYGYWVIVTMITSFFTLVIDAGFEYYYIVKVNINKGEETPQEEVVKIENTVFFLRVIVNLLLFVLQFGLSYLPIDLLSSPVDKIVRLLAFVHIINIMGRINEVRLKKYFNFGKITKYNIVSTIVSTFVQVVCAFLGFGVMSFAWGSLVKVLVNNIGLVSIGRFRPQKQFVSRPILREVLGFALHSWLGNIGLYLNNQIDKFLLKHNFTMTDVGYYSFGNGTAYMFMTYVVYPQGSVIMNYISNHQNHPRKLEEFVAFINKFLFILVLPVQVLLFVFTDEFIGVLYGAKWLVAAPLFRLFILRSFIEILFYPYSSFLTAFGKVDYLAKLNWFSVFLYGISLFLITLISSSITIYAIVFVVCSLIFYLIKTFLSIRISKIRMSHIFSKIKITLLVSLLIVALLFVPSSVGLWLKTALTGLCLTLFFIFVVTFDRSAVVEIDARLLGSTISRFCKKYSNLF